MALYNRELSNNGLYHGVTWSTAVSQLFVNKLIKNKYWGKTHLSCFGNSSMSVADGKMVRLKDVVY